MGRRVQAAPATRYRRPGGSGWGLKPPRTSFFGFRSFGLRDADRVDDLVAFFVFIGPSYARDVSGVPPRVTIASAGIDRQSMGMRIRGYNRRHSSRVSSAAPSGPRQEMT